MPTKTISVDLEAYERLRRARLTPDESFSRVIKRARWRDEHNTSAGLLSALEEAPLRIWPSSTGSTRPSAPTLRRRIRGAPTEPRHVIPRSTHLR